MEKVQHFRLLFPREPTCNVELAGQAPFHILLAAIAAILLYGLHKHPYADRAQLTTEN